MDRAVSEDEVAVVLGARACGFIKHQRAESKHLSAVTVENVGNGDGGRSDERTSCSAQQREHTNDFTP